VSKNRFLSIFLISYNTNKQCFSCYSTDTVAVTNLHHRIILFTYPHLGKKMQKAPQGLCLGRLWQHYSSPNQPPAACPSTYAVCGWPAASQPVHGGFSETPATFFLSHRTQPISFGRVPAASSSDHPSFSQVPTRSCPLFTEKKFSTY
jgi:hypothetical protein